MDPSQLDQLPLDQFPAAITDAIGRLATDPSDRSAWKLLDAVARQHPESLHPHLDRILELRPPLRHDVFPLAWRGAGPDAIPALEAQMEDEDRFWRRRAWKALLLLGCPEGVVRAQARSAEGIEGGDLDFWMGECDLAPENLGVRSLAPAASWHLRWPVTPTEDEYTHPTWSLDQETSPALTGGELETRCPACEEPLVRLLEVSPVPEGLGVTGLERLVLATCSACVGESLLCLHLEHAPDGVVRVAGQEGELRPSHDERVVWPEASIQLARTPARWRLQDWAASSNQENLDHLGGFPSWIQDQGYRPCPGCEQTMSFLLQLDGGLPVPGGEEVCWGMGGLLYLLFCDTCKRSTSFVQCT